MQKEAFRLSFVGRFGVSFIWGFTVYSILCNTIFLHSEHVISAHISLVVHFVALHMCIRKNVQDKLLHYTRLYLYNYIVYLPYIWHIICHMIFYFKEEGHWKEVRTTKSSSDGGHGILQRDAVFTWACESQYWCRNWRWRHTVSVYSSSWSCVPTCKSHDCHVIIASGIRVYWRLGFSLDCCYSPKEWVEYNILLCLSTNNETIWLHTLHVAT